MAASALRPARIALAIGLLCTGRGALACWEEVGQRYNINPYLLAAIAKTESNFKANAVRHNTNGNKDIGVMQVNSLWLPTLAKYGVSEAQLYDLCTNIAVGAWILSQQQGKYDNT